MLLILDSGQKRKIGHFLGQYADHQSKYLLMSENVVSSIKQKIIGP